METSNHAPIASRGFSLFAILLLIVAVILIFSRPDKSSTTQGDQHDSPKAEQPPAVPPAVTPARPRDPHEERLDQLRKKREGIDFSLAIELEATKKVLREDGPDGVPAWEYQRIQDLTARRKAVDAEIEEEERATAPAEKGSQTISGADLEHLKRRRQIDREILESVKSVLGAPSSNEALTAYCTFMARGIAELDKPAEHSSYEQRNVEICRARILSGQDRMLTAAELRRNGDKAQSDLTDVEQKLKDAGVPLEPIAEPARPTLEKKDEPSLNGTTTSGNLHAVVRAEHGEVRFTNLPAARLKFAYDHDAWQATIRREADGSKTLVMRSLKPGSGLSCDVRWEVVQD